MLDELYTDLFGPLIVDHIQDSPLQTICLKIALLELILNLFLKVIYPSELTLQKGYLKRLFIVELISIDLKALVNLIYGLGEIVYGNIYDICGRPCALTKYLDIKIDANISLSDNFLNRGLILLMNVILIYKCLYPFSKLDATTRITHMIT